MNDLITLQPITVPSTWNYEDSVKKTKQLAFNWKNLTKELFDELFVAREILSKEGRPETGTIVPVKTWDGYCQDVGLEKRTVNRWLQRFYGNQNQIQNSPVLLPSGVFNVIYADPPWQYDNSGFEQSAQSHYPTMSNEELYDMAEKLNPVVANPAVLFLWVTNPFLWVGLQLCEAWSFEYKTNFAWTKSKGPSIGWFNKARHELLFIATKGEGMHPVEKPNSWFEGEVTKHSKKPETTYKMIERMYPNQKYLELFARNKREGWESWGNQV